MAIRRTALARGGLAAVVVITWGQLASGQPAGTTSAAVDLWSLAKEKQEAIGSRRFSRPNR